MQEKWYYVALSLVPGIGRIKYERLIKKFKKASDIFRASEFELGRVEGITKKNIVDLKSINHEEIISEQSKEANIAGARLISIEEKEYPANLRNIFNPPPYLFIKGEIKEQDSYAIAIVGARLSSSEGLIISEKLGKEIAYLGVTIVSGMASGIDSRAHIGALMAGGRTIAVLGCGIDIIYPAENMKLMEKIAKCGAVISEFPMGERPKKENFPVRNRIISGISIATVVVEAEAKSGSLITASFAADQGREVFAVPGNILSRKSAGTNQLIHEGAHLVRDTMDIIEALPSYYKNEIIRNIRNVLDKKIEKSKDIENFDSGTLKILQLLENGPKTIDFLITMSGLSTGKVFSIMMDLEIKGYVKQMPGKLFIKEEGKVHGKEISRCC